MKALFQNPVQRGVLPLGFLRNSTDNDSLPYYAWWALQGTCALSTDFVRDKLSRALFCDLFCIKGGYWCSAVA
jgi:hypothetical protein